MESPVLAATRWVDNAAMIADVHRLGYLLDEDHVLDPTYGRGTWWKTWRPEKLTMHHRPDDGSDFRGLPYPDGAFDAIAFDPPYVCAGGRSTTTIKDYHDRYGMDDAPMTPRGVQEQINDGLSEMYRLVKFGGFVIVKCQDYITGGKFWNGTFLTQQSAIRDGFEVVDRLEHLGAKRPQPNGRRQVHARRNISTLFVLRKAS